MLRTVKFLNRQTLDLLYKLTVRSIIDYSLPIYCNSLKQTELKRFEDIQYKAAKLVTGALNFSSRDKLWMGNNKMPFKHTWFEYIPQNS